MKKGIHPNYHFVEVRLNDGTTYKTRTTWGEPGQKLTLDIDPDHAPGLDRRSAAADGPRRPPDALQQEVRRLREVGLLYLSWPANAGQPGGFCTFSQNQTVIARPARVRAIQFGNARQKHWIARMKRR